MVVFNRKDQLQHRFLRALTRRRLEPPVHYVPSVSGFGAAIRLGLGWGMVPEQLAAEDIEAGRCVDLVPSRHLDVPLYWQHWHLDSTVLAALTSAVCGAADRALRKHATSPASRPAPTAGPPAGSPAGSPQPAGGRKGRKV